MVCPVNGGQAAKSHCSHSATLARTNRDARSRVEQMLSDVCFWPILLKK